MLWHTSIAFFKQLHAKVPSVQVSCLERQRNSFKIGKRAFLIPLPYNVLDDLLDLELHDNPKMFIGASPKICVSLINVVLTLFHAKFYGISRPFNFYWKICICN